MTVFLCGGDVDGVEGEDVNSVFEKQVERVAKANDVR
jgi:hypothetical protein